MENIARIIDLGTFTSAWYWLVVIVTWSLASNWLIGVPFDMLFRARKAEGEPLADLEALVALQSKRLAWYQRVFGPWLTGFLAFFLTALMVMGFAYQLEFAKGMFLLGAPLSVVLIINLRLAVELDTTPLAGKALVKRLFVVRLWIQIIAMVTLFFTAVYGMAMALSQLYLF